MENAEEILQSLDSFSKLRPKDIPRELEEYLCFVARTGDPVYHWSITKSLFREKLLHVLTEFHDTTPGLDLPPCPNVDAFNYDTMKNCLLERIESFSSTPFTVQRICELLTSPRKQYSRIDKYMRAIEKNILVVSTREPGSRESEGGDPLEAILNGDGFDMHIEIEMDGNATPLAECTVNRNDTSYSIATESSNNSTSADLVTNCQNDISDHSEPNIELEIENEPAKEEPEIINNVKDESLATPDVDVGQNVPELSTPFAEKKIEDEEREEDVAIELAPESSVIDSNSIDIESSVLAVSSAPQHPNLETFIPTNDTEESTDTSETDSNLTEDSVTSELQEAATGVEENALIASDVESSNDETPFQQAPEPTVEPVEIINPVEETVVNVFEPVVKNEDSQINVIENPVEEKQVDKIENNMEKFFQTVCETPETTEPITEPKEVEQIILNDVESHPEPVITEPYDSCEPAEAKDEIVLPVQNEELVSEVESERMVDVVENDFLAQLKQNENVSEAIEQDQTESMDIPESAMEVEDTPVTSEPMDQ